MSDDTQNNDPLLHQLHTEIDVAEAIRANAKVIALRILEEELAGALEVSTGDGAHAASRVTEAMQFLSGELADELDDLTAKAMKQGFVMGQLRVEAAEK